MPAVDFTVCPRKHLDPHGDGAKRRDRGAAVAVRGVVSRSVRECD